MTTAMAGYVNSGCSRRKDTSSRHLRPALVDKENILVLQFFLQWASGGKLDYEVLLV